MTSQALDEQTTDFSVFISVSKFESTCVCSGKFVTDIDSWRETSSGEVIIVCAKRHLDNNENLTFISYNGDFLFQTEETNVEVGVFAC